MRSTYEQSTGIAREIERNLLQGTATICSSPFGICCKALWPYKTAEELASRAGCAVRTAAYQISGEHEPSGQALLAVMTAITPKRR